MSISIVISVKNRKDLLDIGLSSLLNQSDKDFEVVISDSLSTDGIEEVIAKYRNAGLNIKHVRVDEGKHRYENVINNPALLMNCGIYSATNNNIILTVPEFVHDADNVKNAKELLKNTNSVYYGDHAYFYHFEQNNKMLDELSKTGFKYTDNLRAELKNDTYNNQNLIPVRSVELHFVMALTKELFFKVGGFDEEFLLGYAYEDSDLPIRMKAAGINVNTTDMIFGVHFHHARQEARFDKAAFDILCAKNAALQNKNTLKAKGGTFKVNDHINYPLTEYILN